MTPASYLFIAGALKPLVTSVHQCSARGWKEASRSAHVAHFDDKVDPEFKTLDLTEIKPLTLLSEKINGFNDLIM